MNQARPPERIVTGFVASAQRGMPARGESRTALPARADRFACGTMPAWIQQATPVLRPPLPVPTVRTVTAWANGAGCSPGTPVPAPETGQAHSCRPDDEVLPPAMLSATLIP